MPEWFKNHRPLPDQYLALTGVLLLLLAACSTVAVKGPDGRRSLRDVEEFRAYAEEVFRQQNQTGSELTLLLMDTDPSESEQYQRLLEADERIIRACGPLNSLAIKIAEEKHVNMNLQLSILDTITECERTTKEIRSWLDSLEQAP